MTTSTEQVTAQLPLRKRKQEDESVDEEEKDAMRPLKRGPISKAREVRLEQNRKAARESRRRKKVMIEELQRSVVFFSRANNTLKHQNDDLSRLVMQAQAQVAAIEGQHTSNLPPSQPAADVKTEAPQQQQGNFQQAEAQAVATQAVYESQGFSAAAARAAAQTMNGAGAGSNNNMSSSPSPSTSNSPGHSLPAMQPGATMQAMANFQQAAAAAMQAAVQGMQNIPGLSVQALAATTPSGSNSQQTYNDTMAALAMQQAAAAAAAGQQFFQQNPFLSQAMMAWPGNQATAGGQAQSSQQ